MMTSARLLFTRSSQWQRPESGGTSCGRSPWPAPRIDALSSWITHQQAPSDASMCVRASASGVVRVDPEGNRLGGEEGSRFPGNHCAEIAVEWIADLLRNWREKPLRTPTNVGKRASYICRTN